MLKSLLQKCIYRLFAKAEDEVLSALADKTVVSFDVFDTLILREVERPRDLFLLMEKQFLLAGDRQAEDFAVLRIHAEEKVRELHSEREVTLSEIYDAMPVNESLREAWKSAECQMEIGISAPNQAMKHIYDVCIAQKKEVCFISDMYLPAETVRAILNKNGYSCGKLYVSSESGLLKRRGELFSFVQKEEHIDKEKWGHVGDSIISDYLVPRKLGIHSILTARSVRRDPYVDRRIMRISSAYRQVNHFIDIHIDRYDDPYERIGYSVLGPLLYGFSKWLERMLPADEKIVFLAREGKLLRKAFEIVTGRNSVYFYISRRAANNAYLGIAESQAEASQKKYRTIIKRHTSEQLALGYGLTPDEVKTTFAKEQIEPDAVVVNEEAEGRIVSAIWPIVKRRGCEQHELLQRYLDQIGITEKCALVDVGWLGTMQLLLEKGNYLYKDKPIRWNGYYVGINRNSQGPDIHAQQRRAFLYVDGAAMSKTQKRIKDNVVATVAFLEMLFMSAEGTTLSYGSDGENRVYPILDHSDNEADINLNITAMQTAALAFVEEYAHTLTGSAAEVDASAAIGNYMAFAASPSQRTLELFRRFGYRDGSDRQLFVCGYKLSHYLRHPKSFVLDFFNSTCKVWFLKSLIKIPLPYVFLTSALRSVFADRRMKE